MPSDQHLGQKAKLLALFGDQTRVKIFCQLLECKCCVSEIAKNLDMTVAAISYHLQLFRKYGLVEVRRKGQTKCYSLVNNRTTKLLQELICD